MAGQSMRADVLGELKSLTQVGVVGNLTDTQLLDRFLVGGEVAELAFHALVSRHGQMVLHVCGKLLHDPDDVQDAFQATFLVLASRARSIRQRSAVGGWLLGVARRVALRSRAEFVRRRMHERLAAETKANREVSSHESWPEIHEEIDRLPERYREPVVLCYLEGLSTEAAALRLGCPKGTVLSRLSRARERLRRSLTRRGLPLQAGVLPALSTAEAAQFANSSALVSETVRASLKLSEQPSIAAALSSTTAVSLARGVIYAMTITKTKIIAGAVLACVLTLSALHTFARQLGGPAGPGKTPQPAPRANEREAALLLRAQAARRAFEMATKDLSSGLLTDIEVVYRWSHRWMDDDIAASNSKQERIAAAEAHLKRMQDLERVAPELKKVHLQFPSSSEAAAKYYRLEAEAALAEARR